MARDRRRLPPVLPGEILKEEFLSPLDISINYLARALHVAPNRIGQIVNGRRAITAATALRLSAFFGTTPEFWMNLQSLYELEVARAAEGDSIRREVRRMKPPARVETGMSC